MTSPVSGGVVGTVRSAIPTWDRVRGWKSIDVDISNRPFEASLWERFGMTNSCNAVCTTFVPCSGCRVGRIAWGGLS